MRVGRAVASRVSFVACLPAATRIEAAAEAGDTLAHLARIHVARSDLVSARSSIGRALAQFAKLDERDGPEAEAWRLLAEVARRQGDAQRAGEAVRKAEEIEHELAAAEAGV